MTTDTLGPKRGGRADQGAVQGVQAADSGGGDRWSLQRGRTRCRPTDP